MDSDSKVKWSYTFVLLILTMLWAGFLVVFSYIAIQNGVTVADLIAASGISVLLGALIAWNGNVNQHWFRKGKPEERAPPNNTSGT